MRCDIFINRVGFQVGRKYLNLYRAGINKNIERLPLTPELLEKLQEIKDTYLSDDVDRTYNVIKLFNNDEYYLQVDYL